MAADTKFIADRIFPIYPVDTDVGDFMRIRRGKGQLLSKAGADTDASDPLLRAPGGEYRQVTRSEEKDSWKCLDRGLEETIDDKIKQKVARFYEKEKAVSKLLMRNMRISREARAAKKLFSEANLGTAIDGTAVPFIEANKNDIDFPSLLKAAILKLEKRQEDGSGPVLVISNALWDLVTRATKTAQFFFGTAGGAAMVTKQMVMEKFELSDILIGKSSFDTTREGRDSDDSKLVWTWGDIYFAVVSIQDGPPEMGGIGRTFCLEQMTEGLLFTVESQYFWKNPTRATIIRVREDTDLKIVNENSGVLVKVNAP